MLYPVCPTCRMLLADKQIPYEKKLKELENKNLSNDKFSLARGKILDDLGLDRYCCRARIISYVKHEDVVV